MLPWRRLLCPTDFSPPAHVALHAAVDIAEHFGSELHIVHVVPPIPIVAAPLVAEPPLVAMPGGSIATHDRQVQEAATEWLRETARVHVREGLTARLVVETGEPAERIVALAVSRGIDLIVIGTHGQTGWRRFVFGSIAERVVRHSVIPVLTVQPQQPL